MQKLNEEYMSWQPITTVEMLQFRALILKKVRAFFEQREVLEVETPLLMPSPVTDPFIETFNFDTLYGRGYLQSSPEYAMKRLLAFGSGSIYQICKAFRSEEISPKHNPEFTMLEWYRVDFDHFQLMAEIKNLMKVLLPSIKIKEVTYQALFEKYLGINPHIVGLDELLKLVDQHIGKIYGMESVTKYHALELLFSYQIEPFLEKNIFYFIYHYTEAQKALARMIETDQGEVAARFECYYQGLELANGYCELRDFNEQKRRFEADLKVRDLERKEAVPIDQAFLAALAYGLPRCSGVALGFDRLLMALSQSSTIEEVIAFR
ncbi:EF-P lysine aminoacylase GenX [Thiotrichales bacterium 19S11-10]|nr:EF-P lysine aminoacylase GenX [Thiotrichales bacterium 19S11-10]